MGSLNVMKECEACVQSGGGHMAPKLVGGQQVMVNDFSVEEVSN